MNKYMLLFDAEIFLFIDLQLATKKICFTPFLVQFRFKLKFFKISKNIYFILIEEINVTFFFFKANPHFSNTHTHLKKLIRFFVGIYFLIFRKIVHFRLLENGNFFLFKFTFIFLILIFFCHATPNIKLINKNRKSRINKKKILILFFIQNNNLI